MLFDTKRRLLIGVLILTLVGLVVIASLGIYVRPNADDYYYLAYDSQSPYRVFDFQINGRLAALLIYALGYPIPYFLKISPLLTIAILFISSFYLALVTLKSLKSFELQRLKAASIASTLTLAICLAVPNLFQSFFRFSATPVHTWSYSLILLYLGMLLDYKRWEKLGHRTSVAIFLLMPIFIGTLYEGSSAILILISSIILILAYWKQHSYKLIAWLTSAGSVFSFLVLLFSPGAMDRRAIVDSHREDLVQRALDLPRILLEHFSLLPNVFEGHLGVLVIIMLLATIFTIFYLHKQTFSLRSSLIMIIASFFSAILIDSINIAVLWMGTASAAFPPRIYFITTLVASILAIVIGYVLGQLALKLSTFSRGMITGAIIMLATIIVFQSFLYVPYLRHFRGHLKVSAIEWDKRDGYIRQKIKQGACNIQTTPIGYGKLADDISSNEKDWSVDAISSYYGFYPDSPCRIYRQK